MHFISNLFSQQDLIKLENWRIKSVKKIFLHGDFMMNLKVICVRRLRQIANWWSLLHESWMNVCLCVWPDIYITWLSSSWFPCSPSLVSWGQRHRVEGINMILTTDTAPARQAPGHQGLCRIATLAWPGSLAIKLVFYCQPRHNLPLIINLPHSSRDWLTGLSPCLSPVPWLHLITVSLLCEMNHCHVWRILNPATGCGCYARVLSWVSWDGPNLWLSVRRPGQGWAGAGGWARAAAAVYGARPGTRSL